MSETPSSYAGRWVARVRGQIVAQGGTPEQARRASQSSRHKEPPEIIFMPPTTPLKFSALLDKVRDALPDVELYLVGGAVRDALLNRVSLDLDFALPSDGIRTSRRLADALGAGIFPLDDERDTGRVIVTHADGSREKLDFATYRGDSLDADLRARDFTVNAMAVDLKDMSLLDPLEGAADLRAKKIRACSDTSLSDDPIRILRGIRLAASLDFEIEPSTRKMMKSAAKLLPKISPERLRDEIFRICAGPRQSDSFRALELLGVLPHILPELSALKGVEQPTPHVHEVWEHTLQVLSALERILRILEGDESLILADPFAGPLVARLGMYREKFAAHFSQSLNEDREARPLLFLSALYHDIAKPQSATKDETGRIRFWGHDEEGTKVAAHRLRELHLSNDEVARVETVIRNHMRLHYHSDQKIKKGLDPSRRAIYRFFRDSGKAGVDLTLLALADLRGTYGEKLTQETWSAALDVAQIFLENYFERPEESIAPPRLLDGNDLMRELGIAPGPRLGELLEAIREAQADGEVRTREEAIALARKLIEMIQK